MIDNPATSGSLSITEYKLVTVYENGLDTTLSINVPVLLIAIFLSLISVSYIPYNFIKNK